MRAASSSLLAAIFAASCSCGGHRADGDAGVDAGDASDAGDARAARDTGSAIDSAAPDARVDAGITWYMPDGLPDGCEVRAADDPAGARLVVFDECPDRSGCRRLRTDALLEAGEVLHAGWYAGRHDGTVGYLPLRVASDRWETELLFDETGRMLLALQAPRGAQCVLGAMSSTAGHVAVIVLDRVSTEGSDCYVLDCPIATPSGRCRVIAYWPESELTGNFAQDVYAGATHLAVHTTPAQTAWRVEWDASGRIPVGGWRTERILGEPSAAANEATFYSLVSAPRVVSVSVGPRPGDPPSRALVTGDGFDALILKTDGEDMVWHQGYEREDVNLFGRVELWTSPFATTAESLMPRRLTTLRRRSASRASQLGFRRFATLENEQVIAVYDLRDGSRQQVVAPDREVWSGGVVYVGPQEIAVASGPESAVSRRETTVMIVRYDSLGAASPPTP